MSNSVEFQNAEQMLASLKFLLFLIVFRLSLIVLYVVVFGRSSRSFMFIIRIIFLVQTVVILHKFCRDCEKQHLHCDALYIELCKLYNIHIADTSVSV